MKPLTIAICLAGLCTLFAAAGDPTSAERDALYRMAKLVRLDESVMRWREIPWYTNAIAGLKAARQEKRPVLLFVTGDDPLGRC
jgi:hypothetical protein